MESTSPLTIAHEHATKAENYLSQGLIMKASDEHKLAAEAFAQCIDASSDENRKRTFRMLYNENVKAEKELQKKILRLQKDGKDPSLPQRLRRDSSPARSDGARESPPPHARRVNPGMSDSQKSVAIDESFMVLGQRSDPGDAFNNFWNIMEGMLPILSQPVAFATAPLGNDVPSLESSPTKRGTTRRDTSSSSDTDCEDLMSTRISRRIGMGKKLLAGGGKNKAGPSRSVKSVPAVPEEEFEDEFDSEGGDELSESFCLIPSGKVPSASRILPQPSPSGLQQENGLLKAEVQSMQKRLAAAERVLQLRKEQDVQLRDSIVMAKREAHRAMGASALLPRPSMDFTMGSTTLPGSPSMNVPNITALNIPGGTAGPPISVPIPPLPSSTGGRDREPQLLRRVRELEEEVRVVKAENEKQKAMISKFRERWDKLKESAKRKKDARAASAIAGQRIEEEPEAEAEQDPEDNKSSQ